ncbi:hypothetical protein BD779DRAFT_1483917 [Infundibulicybe gibba]|nr:hypothetical protein BD779DRAFT_1483917 [Infundibulicybe gibba]
MAKGTKRASPGAEEEKNPLQNIELSDEDAKKLQSVQRDIAHAELVLERQAQMKLAGVYEKRRQVIKSIPKFWPVALMNNSRFAFHVQHGADQLALSYLEDLWVARDPAEPRCYSIEFHFKENPHFSDTVLKKEFKYNPPPASADETPDEDGITESMLEFSWERDVTVSATKINWKDPEKALTKLYPREAGEDEDDIPAEMGSFFNFFEHETDPSEIGLAIGNEIFPEAIDYFLGNAGGDLDSEDEEDDEDDDDDAEEIDLEKPRTKKQKV